MRDRNLTAHLYDENASKKIFDRIKTRYSKAFEALKEYYEGDDIGSGSN